MFTGIVGINTPVLCSSLVIVVITQVRHTEREIIYKSLYALNYDSGSKYGNSHRLLKLKLCFHTAGSVVSVGSVFMDTEVRRLSM